MHHTRWFKYDRDKLWLVYTQIVLVIFEPPCILLPRESVNCFRNLNCRTQTHTYSQTARSVCFISCQDIKKVTNYETSSSLSSSSSLGATALREPWPPVLFASTNLYPELSFSILQSPSLVGPLERHNYETYRSYIGRRPMKGLQEEKQWRVNMWFYLLTEGW
jgi:hypothetical protein